MLNKKEYIMLELVKMAGDINMIDRSAIERFADWMIDCGEAYQIELEERERMLDDEIYATLDLDSGEL